MQCGGSFGGKNGRILDCIGDGRRRRFRLLQRELEIHVVEAGAIMRTKKTKEGMGQKIFGLVKLFNVGVQLAVNTKLKG